MDVTPVDVSQETDELDATFDDLSEEDLLLEDEGLPVLDSAEPEDAESDENKE